MAVLRILEWVISQSFTYDKSGVIILPVLRSLNGLASASTVRCKQCEVADAYHSLTTGPSRGTDRTGCILLVLVLRLDDCGSLGGM